MRLGDLDTLESRVEELLDYNGEDTYPFAILDMIKDAPAIDAVPVVRCRDCKKFMSYDDGFARIRQHVEGADGGCWIKAMQSKDDQYNAVKLDDFCSWGVRKDGAQ